MEKREWIAMMLVLSCVLFFTGCKNIEVRDTTARNDQSDKYFIYDLPEDCKKIIKKLNLVAIGSITIGNAETTKKYLMIVFGCPEILKETTAWALYSLETKKMIDFVFSFNGEEWYDREENVVDVDINTKVKI